MDDTEWLAGHFERHRPHLRAVAYRMLGSLTEADDAAQDAWVLAFTITGGKIAEIDGLSDPARLHRIAAAVRPARTPGRGGARGRPRP